MKESRLFRILYYLLNKGHASAPELAEKFEVSVRTVYRDIDALSSAGIPVYTESGRNGGICLQKDFVLDKALFSADEKLALLSSLQSLSATGSVNEKETLAKLSGLFHVCSEDWFEVDFSRWGSRPADNTKFELLKKAVVNHQTVSIIYVNSYGIKSKRDINPLKLLYKSKEWYVKAYCCEKLAFRVFKFNRIIKLDPTADHFTPVSFQGLPDSQPESYSDIILRFPREMAYRVYDEFDAREITKQKDGTLTASAKMPEDAWLIGYLLSFGTQVEVLEPAHLRKILSKEAKKIYEMNKS